MLDPLGGQGDREGEEQVLATTAWPPDRTTWTTQQRLRGNRREDTSRQHACAHAHTLAWQDSKRQKVCSLISARDVQIKTKRLPECPSAVAGISHSGDQPEAGISQRWGAHTAMAVTTG